MAGPRIGFVSLAATIMLIAACPAPGTAAAQATSTARASLAAKLRVQRTSAIDLEVGGDLRGLPAGTTRYLTREDLLSASQAMTISADDGNFKKAAEVHAVPLQSLARDLGVPATDMLIADCKDKYQAHFTRRYLADHHPVLVTDLNGASLRESRNYDYGPYLIAHANFKPAFKVLAHSDEPQIPWGVIRLEFRGERAVFGAIAPRGPQAGQSAVQDGFKIAEQNCFRCHNNGAEGGLKSGVTWTVLAALAANSPDFFIEYVRDPKAKNPKTQMAASPAYDDATMRALVAYFRTFAPMETH
jgi:mono/diheme cytochrome c family protein